VLKAIEPPLIGPRLQAQRKARNLTLVELAKSSGVSRSMLSEIERGNANPTFGTLWHLTRALGIDFNTLMDGVTGDDRSIDHQTAPPRITSADGTCTLDILSPASKVSITEWYLLNFAPHGRLISEPHAGGTVEHLHCTDGELTVSSGNATIILRPGEMARYAADLPHRMINTGEGPAKAFLVVDFSTPKTARAR
jgi:transcriptional regulator with XRE-family HTH domain